ncbi:MAG: hypothetical protein K9N62_10595 [Verrucomicrobia bacterium]|jgi:hypothetical protein|nr:hypothetical protein [Verrucomicrobiota bacterium]
MCGRSVEVQIFEGTIGEFTGTVKGSMTSSNAAGCHLKFISDGSMRSGGSVRNTQHVDVPFPRSKKLVMPELGEVTVWFLSDEELRLNAGMFGK